MAEQEQPHAETRDAESLWSLIEKFQTCMLTTLDGDKVRARPMALNPRRVENAIYFLTDISGHKDEEIDRNISVGLSFMDATGNTFISVSGGGRVLNDRALIKDLWKASDAAWWENADDPRIRALEVTPREAQFWNGPNLFVSTAVMIGAAFAGTPRPDMGDNRKVSLS